jgi:hypothetical protein
VQVGVGRQLRWRVGRERAVRFPAVHRCGAPHVPPRRQPDPHRPARCGRPPRSETLASSHASALPSARAHDTTVVRDHDPITAIDRQRAASLSRLFYASSLGSVGLCIALWIRAKTIGEDERGNAERRALFVGLWPPMLWLIGDTVDRRSPPARGLRANLARVLAPEQAASWRLALTHSASRRLRRPRAGCR